MPSCGNDVATILYMKNEGVAVDRNNNLYFNGVSTNFVWSEERRATGSQRQQYGDWRSCDRQTCSQFLFFFSCFCDLNLLAHSSLSARTFFCLLFLFFVCVCFRKYDSVTKTGGKLGGPSFYTTCVCSYNWPVIAPTPEQQYVSPCNDGRIFMLNSTSGAFIAQWFVPVGLYNGVAVDSQLNLYFTTNASTNTIERLSTTTGLTTVLAYNISCSGITLDSAGSLWAHCLPNRVLQIDRSGAYSSWLSIEPQPVINYTPTTFALAINCAGVVFSGSNAGWRAAFYMTSAVAAPGLQCGDYVVSGPTNGTGPGVVGGGGASSSGRAGGGGAGTSSSGGIGSSVAASSGSVGGGGSSSGAGSSGGGVSSTGAGAAGGGGSSSSGSSGSGSGGSGSSSGASPGAGSSAAAAWTALSSDSSRAPGGVAAASSSTGAAQTPAPSGSAPTNVSRSVFAELTDWPAYPVPLPLDALSAQQVLTTTASGAQQWVAAGPLVQALVQCVSLDDAPCPSSLLTNWTSPPLSLDPSSSLPPSSFVLPQAMRTQPGAYQFAVTFVDLSHGATPTRLGLTLFLALDTLPDGACLSTPGCFYPSTTFFCHSLASPYTLGTGADVQITPLLMHGGMSQSCDALSAAGSVVSWTELLAPVGFAWQSTWVGTASAASVCAGQSGASPFSLLIPSAALVAGRYELRLDYLPLGGGDTSGPGGTPTTVSYTASFVVQCAVAQTTLTNDDLVLLPLTVQPGAEITLLPAMVPPSGLCSSALPGPGWVADWRLTAVDSNEAMDDGASVPLPLALPSGLLPQGLWRGGAVALAGAANVYGPCGVDASFGVSSPSVYNALPNELALILPFGIEYPGRYTFELHLTPPNQCQLPLTLAAPVVVANYSTARGGAALVGTPFALSSVAVDPCATSSPCAPDSTCVSSVDAQSMTATMRCICAATAYGSTCALNVLDCVGCVAPMRGNRTFTLVGLGLDLVREVWVGGLSVASSAEYLSAGDPRLSAELTSDPKLAGTNFTALTFVAPSVALMPWQHFTTQTQSQEQVVQSNGGTLRCRWRRAAAQPCPLPRSTSPCACRRTTPAMLT